MTANQLDYHTIDPAEQSSQIDSCVIWLHGLGANGHDIVPVVEQTDIQDNHNVRFIFPHAPSRPITINQGLHLPAWYDILGLDGDSQQDHDGVLEASSWIEHLIDEMAQQVPAHRIVLAGYSQGGAIALFTGLRYRKTLGGIVALSCYLPIAEKFFQTKHDANANTPIFMGHGTNDDVVLYEWGKQAHTALAQHEYPISWKSYPIGHEISREEIDDVSTFINHRLHQSLPEA